MKSEQQLRKKHGQVEQHKRIDSYEAEHKSFIVAPFSLLPFTRTDDKVYFDDGATITLDYVHNAAGRLTFFLCPSCGARVRFLYLPGLQCRKCSYLNYRSQQITKGSLQDFAAIPNKYGFDYDMFGLVRPRYMHRSRFDRLDIRFLKKSIRHIRKVSNAGFFFGKLEQTNAITPETDLLTDNYKDMVSMCTELPELKAPDMEMPEL